MDYIEFSEFLFKIYGNTSSICVAIVGPLFLLRIIQNSLMGSATDYFAIFKSLVTCFILLFSFKYILEGITLFLDEFYPRTSSFEVAKPEKEGRFYAPWSVMKFVQTCTVIFYWIGSIIHLFILSILSAIAPIIFILGTMLGIGIGIKVFFGMLIMSASWPIVWQAIDQFSVWIGENSSSSFSAHLLVMATQILKIIGPASIAIASMNSGPVQMATNLAQGIASKGTSLVAKNTLKLGQNQAQRISNNVKSDFQWMRETNSSHKNTDGIPLNKSLPGESRTFSKESIGRQFKMNSFENRGNSQSQRFHTFKPSGTCFDRSEGNSDQKNLSFDQFIQQNQSVNSILKSSNHQSYWNKSVNSSRKGPEVKQTRTVKTQPINRPRNQNVKDQISFQELSK